MTSSSSQDKKIGRDAAQTMGRTTGGYKPKTAKWSKRRGSKGARRVAKQKLHRSSIGESIATIFEGGTIMVKQSFLDSLKKTHPEKHAELMKKYKGTKRPTRDEPSPKKEQVYHDKAGQRWTDHKAKLRKKYGTDDLRKVAKAKEKLGEAKDYSDSKKNHYELYSDKDDHHKAHDEIHKAVTHKSGNPKHMNAAMKKHSKHGASDTSSREAIVGHFMKHHADKKGKTWSLQKEEKMSGQEYSSYMKKVKSKDPEVKKAVGQVLDKKFVKQKGPATSRYHAKVSGDPEVKKAQKHMGEEKYPQSLLLKGDKDAAKKTKEQRVKDKEMKRQAMGEWTDVAGHGEDPNDATPPAKLTSSQKKRLAAQTQKFKKKMSAKEATEYLNIPEGYIEELSPATLERYRDKSHKEVKSRMKVNKMLGDLKTPKKDTVIKYHDKQIKKRIKGMTSATKILGLKTTQSAINPNIGEGKGPQGQGDKWPGDFDTGPKTSFKAKRLKMIKKAAEKIQGKKPGLFGKKVSEGMSNKDLLRSKKNDTADTGGFRISDADAKKAKARLKKKYGKFARHFKEFREELDPKTATKKQIRQADIKGEIGKKKPKGHPPGPMMKMYGPFDRSKLKKKLKEVDMKRSYNPKGPHFMNDHDQARKEKEKAKVKKKLAKAWPWYDIEKGGAKKIKEEQQRVIESLANLASRGIDHKPIQKKKSKIDPGLAVRKATAERLQKGAKAQIRGTTARQKFGEEAPPTAKHERMVKAIKKSYAKKGKTTDKYTAIAHATAWDHFNKRPSIFKEAYPVYKTKEYLDRPSRAERSDSYKQKLANKKVAVSIHKFRNKDANKRKKVTNPTPTMNHIKDTMWGKGKHSTIKPYMEGTWKDQLEPEYTEGKQRIKNKIRAKLGLKAGPQGDWKKEMKLRHAREKMIKSFKKESIKYPKSAIKDMNKLADKHDKTWWKSQDKAKLKKKLKETELPPHLAKFINPKTGNLKAKYEKRMNKPQELSSKKPKFTVKDVTPKGYGPSGVGLGQGQVGEDAASGRPIKKPVKKIKKKDSGKDGAFVFSSPKSSVIGTYGLKSDKPRGKWIGKNLKRYPTPAWSIGQKELAAGDIAINDLIGVQPMSGPTGLIFGIKPLLETAEYKAAMGPGSHEWGTDIGRDYFKKLTPGQDNPPEDPIKPLNIKARKPQDEKGVKITEGDGINVCPKEPIDLSGIVAKQAEYTKEKYPEVNAVDAQWKSNVDGILTGAYEGGEITWADVIALDKEAENITFDQEVEMGLYDPEELEVNDFDGDPLNDTEILEVLSVTGRMKRRFSARRNRQKLKVARAIALRRGSTPGRIKRRAVRGARLMVYKRILRGRSRAGLPPAEKARLENMIKRFQPLVNRIAVKLMPQIRKNEIKRMGNRGKRSATVSKKFKAAKPVRSASQGKSHKFKAPKRAKYKAPKPKRYRMRGASGGPTLKRASKAYKAFSFSVG